MPKSLIFAALAVVLGTGCQTSKSAGRITTWTANAGELNADGMRDSLGMEGLDKAQFAALAASRIKTITFDLDSYTLTPEARDILKKNAGLIQAAEGTISIQGHADELGTEEYNLALSERRAIAVRDYYERMGVPRQRMKTVAYGELKPLCTDSRGDCWRLNRRAKTVLDY